MRITLANTWNSPNRWIIVLATTLVVAGLGTAIAVLIKFHQAATPQTPSAFYTPPEPLPQGEPGTILH